MEDTMMGVFRQVAICRKCRIGMSTITPNLKAGLGELGLNLN
jgi:hypothetical protein